MNAPAISGRNSRQPEPGCLFCGADAWARTTLLRTFKPALNRLSYIGIVFWCWRVGSNHVPPAYEIERSPADSFSVIKLAANVVVFFPKSNYTIATCTVFKPTDSS